MGREILSGFATLEKIFSLQQVQNNPCFYTQKLSPPDSTGALPLDPTGDFRPQTLLLHASSLTWNFGYAFADYWHS